jgi:hypothetical protein
MDSNPSVWSLRELVRKAALERAANLSGAEAHEIWRVMQLLATDGPYEALVGSVVELAMDFRQFPEASTLIAEKARAFESNTGEPKG